MNFSYFTISLYPLFLHPFLSLPSFSPSFSLSTLPPSFPLYPPFLSLPALPPSLLPPFLSFVPCPQSIVLHNMTLSSASSDFSVPIGLKVSGVDNSTFSLTGEAFSAVLGPKTATNTARVMQSDDVALAYEFSRKVIINAFNKRTHATG